MPRRSRSGRARAQRTRTSARTAIPWRVLAILAAGALAYANALDGPFVLDDQNAIVANPAIRQLSRVPTVLQQHDTPIAGRPVAAATFAVDYAIAGLSVVPYHVTNIAIHLSCALLIFAIARRTSRLAGNEVYADRGDDLAFAIALLWVLHPLNSEPVDYLTERSESLMAFFLLWTLYAAIRSAEPVHALAWQLVASGCCVLGMACKESMVVAPIAVILYDRTFLFRSFADAFAARRRLYAMLAVGWLVLACLMLSGPRSGSVGFAHGGAWPYLLNQAGMIVRYIRLALWPTALVVNYGPVVDSLQLRDVLAPASVLLVLLSLTIVGFARRPRLGFLAAWVFITLAPTSSVIPIATEVGAERRMYVPMIGIVALAVVAPYSLAFVRQRVSRVAALATLAVIALALGLTTAARNREYASGLTLAESVLRRWPSDVARGMVGAELMSHHRDAEALLELRLAARTDPRSRYNLGAELFNAGTFDEAASELTAFADRYPTREEVPMARRLAGRAFARQQDWPRAIAQLTTALSMMPNDGETRRALVESESSYGLALVHAGDLTQALAAFRQAVALDPTRVRSRQALAAALIDSGDPAAAEQEAHQAVSIGRDTDSYDLLARALALQGKTDDAVVQLRRALELSPHNARVEDDLRRVLAARGK